MCLLESIKVQAQPGKNNGCRPIGSKNLSKLVQQRAARVSGGTSAVSSQVLIDATEIVPEHGPADRHHHELQLLCDPGTNGPVIAC
jgi:hypothetical protein